VLLVLKMVVIVTLVLHGFGLSTRLQFNVHTAGRVGLPFIEHITFRNSDYVVLAYLARENVFVGAISIGENECLRLSCHVISLQLKVDAIFSSTFVVWLVLVPSNVVVDNPSTLLAAPGPTSSAVPLSSCCPVVEIASPVAIIGHVAQTL
jgi:hypothetical protein